jgi:hypothetical protein
VTIITICLSGNIDFIYQFSFLRSQQLQNNVFGISICDVKSIFAAIKQFSIDKQLDLRKMVLFKTDGAAVVLGKHNGVAALLKK